MVLTTTATAASTVRTRTAASACPPPLRPTAIGMACATSHGEGAGLEDSLPQGCAMHAAPFAALHRQLWGGTGW